MLHRPRHGVEVICPAQVVQHLSVAAGGSRRLPSPLGSPAAFTRELKADHFSFSSRSGFTESIVEDLVPQIRPFHVAHAQRPEHRERSERQEHQREESVPQYRKTHQPRADCPRIDFFCNNACVTSSCRSTSKAPSTSAKDTKAHTHHSAALLRTCRNVTVTPAVHLASSKPRMFVSWRRLSLRTASHAHRTSVKQLAD